MKLSLFDVVCAGCELTFKAPDIAPNAYGEFLLRSDGAGAARYLNALQDRTYVEVEALLRAEARVVALAPVRRAKLLQDVFGPAACDPDASGAPLRIGVNAALLNFEWVAWEPATQVKTRRSSKAGCLGERRSDVV